MTLSSKANKNIEELNDLTVNTELVGPNDEVIGTHESADGDLHLGVTVEQNVITDTNNSSTTNLTSGNSYTFTGTATSTLGVVGLQWSLKTDQDATVYIDESPDGSNWDISYEFDYIASKGGDGGTLQATLSYWRIRVILTGTTDTTYFRLSGILCPIAVPMPSALSSDGRLEVQSSFYDPVSNMKVKITPFGKQKVVNPIRDIGTSFSGTVKDIRFWTETLVGSGSVSQAGEVTLSTGVTENSSVIYESVRRARHIAGSANEFKFTGRLVTAPQANNIRRCGVYDDNDGFFFQVNGVTFGVGARKGGVDTIVASGSFNGDYGTSLTMSTGMGNFVIWWWERKAYFFVNGRLLHAITASTTSLVNTNTLPIRMENVNSGGNTTNNSFEILVASVFKLGNLVTNSAYYHISGNAAVHYLKKGAGVLHKIIFNNTSGTSITIFDNTATQTADIVGKITTTSNAIGDWDYDVPLSNGLTLMTVGNSLDATIVYE